MFPCLPTKKKKPVRIQSLKCQLWSSLVYYEKLFLLVSKTKLLTISSALPRFHPLFQIYKDKTKQVRDRNFCGLFRETVFHNLLVPEANSMGYIPIFPVESQHASLYI